MTTKLRSKQRVKEGKATARQVLQEIREQRPEAVGSKTYLWLLRRAE